MELRTLLCVLGLPQQPSVTLSMSLSLFILEPCRRTCMPCRISSLPLDRLLPHPSNCYWAFVSSENSWLSFRTWLSSSVKASLSSSHKVGGGSGLLHTYSMSKNSLCSRHGLCTRHTAVNLMGDIGQVSKCYIHRRNKWLADELWKCGLSLRSRQWEGYGNGMGWRKNMVLWPFTELFFPLEPPYLQSGSHELHECLYL